jgi:hypothetical protein
MGPSFTGEAAQPTDFAAIVIASLRGEQHDFPAN